MGLVVKDLCESCNSNNTLIFSVSIVLFEVSIVSLMLKHPCGVDCDYPHITGAGNAVESGLPKPTS